MRQAACIQSSQHKRRNPDDRMPAEKVIRCKVTQRPPGEPSPFIEQQIIRGSPNKRQSHRRSKKRANSHPVSTDHASTRAPHESRLVWPALCSTTANRQGLSLVRRPLLQEPSALGELIQPHFSFTLRLLVVLVGVPGWSCGCSSFRFLISVSSSPQAESRVCRTLRSIDSTSCGSGV